MPLAYVFWILMLFCLFERWWFNSAPGRPWWPGGLLQFALFALLGWQVFGAAVK